MAYDRVNWQNQPSTATPVNADNLNKMDSGIKALEEGKIAKTDLVQTDQVNNPDKVPSSAVTHALGQEIDTLNNNLAKYLTLDVGTTINTPGTDLATIVTPGVYYCPGNEIARTLLNCPLTEAFSMEVSDFNGVRVRQKITQYRGSKVFIRTITAAYTNPKVDVTYEYSGTLIE